MNTNKILRIVLVVLLLTTVVAAAATSWTATAGTDFVTSTGVEVSLLGDEEIESGDLFTSSSVTLQNVTFHGNNATVAMYPHQWNGTWTNITAMNVVSGNLTIDPEDKNEFTFNRSITTANFTTVVPSDGIKTDFYYSSVGTYGTIVVPNVTANQQWGMIDPVTQFGLDVAVANATGYVTFDEVPVKTNQAVAIEPLGILYIRNEVPEPHYPINTTTVIVKFYPEGGSSGTGAFQIVEKATTNGQIDLTGLPILGTFEVIAQAPGYHNRTALIRNLGLQNTMFMLNKTADVTNVHFKIDDQTGSFCPDCGVSIFIKRAINVTSYDATNSTGWAWMTMAGMNMGNSMTFNSTLNTNERYDIILQNDQGDVRSMGGYVPTWDNPATAQYPQVLQVQNADVAFNRDDGFEWNATFNATDPSNPTLHLRYLDPKFRTSNFTWWVTQYNNDTPIWSSSQLCNPINCGNITAVQGTSGALDPYYLNRTLAVHLEFWKLSPTPGLMNGTTTVQFDTYQKFEVMDILNKEGIFSDVLPVSTYWLHLIAVGLIILTGAGVGATLNKGIGGMMVSLLAMGLNVMGFMPPEIDDRMYAVALLLSIIYWYATEKS